MQMEKNERSMKEFSKIFFKKKTNIKISFKAISEREKNFFYNFCVCYFKWKEDENVNWKINTDNTFLNELNNYTLLQV